MSTDVGVLETEMDAVEASVATETSRINAILNLSSADLDTFKEIGPPTAASAPR